MISDHRRQRMASVLARRMSWVRCAVESVHHPHNVAAILRSCDSFGVHHVHLIEGRIKKGSGASRGAERWLALHQHDNAAEAITAIKAQGFQVWIADLAEPPVPPEAVPIDRPVCLWFGAEMVGVSAEARAAADGVVTIPMRGFSQSLNVSVAAALTLRPVAEAARAMHGSDSLLSDTERDATWKRWVDREELMTRHLAGRVTGKNPQST
jgi:tRNA (guanosine-2'-O-)-methyltransferase